jgi:protein SCO1/2
MSWGRNIGIAVIAITAMAAGFWLSSSLNNSNQQNNSRAKVIQGNILPVARNIAVPELFKNDGSMFTNSDLQGHWTLIFFGYTHCPDICPTTLGVLAQAKKNIGDDIFPRVLFVSVDPGRDTVEVLNEYVRYFDPAFTGVTGKPKLIEALTLQMSVVYMEAPRTSEDGDDYAVDHSSSILMINREGKLYAFLQPPHSVTSITDSVKTIIDGT